MSEEVVKPPESQVSAPAASAPAAEGSVPYARFAEVVQAKNALLEKAARADALQTALQEAQAKVAQTEAQFTTFRTVASTIGHTDPEAVELVQWAYGRVPAEGRLELGTWLTGIKADPTLAPLAIKHLLGSVVAPGSQPAPPAPVGAPRPQPAASPAGTPATNPTPSDADLARVREQCVRTGDWTPWKEMKKNLPR